jgi:hypothetical protein
MARFVDNAWSLGVKTNAARCPRVIRLARSRTPRAGGELRHMTCSPRRTTLHDLLEDDAMAPTRDRVENLVMQIQADYLEHPTLALTLPAAQTRFGLDEVTCAGVLGALVDARVLTQHGGAYSRYCPRLTGRRAA